MQDALILSGFLFALLMLFFSGWVICTAAVALNAFIKNKDVAEAISPWLEEL